MWVGLGLWSVTLQQRNPGEETKDSALETQQASFEIQTLQASNCVAPHSHSLSDFQFPHCLKKNDSNHSLILFISYVLWGLII